MTALGQAHNERVAPIYAALRPRRVEAGILVMVAVVVVVAYVLASLGRTASIPANFGPFLGWMLALGGVAHVAVRRLAPGADPVILPMALLLNGLGYVMIARLAEHVPGGSDLAGLQATWTAVGVFGFIVTLVLIRPVRILVDYRYLLGVAGLGLLVLPFVPGVGREIRGARIWASLGPINLQPGEFAKIALAAFFAAYLVDARDLLRNRVELRDLVPIGIAWVGSLGVMVFQRDLGSSLLFFTVFIVVLWVASERTMVLVLGFGLFLVGAVFSWTQFTHVQQRVDIWLDPWADSRDTGFQIVEASFALADGGLTGAGLGQGEPDRIPIVESDFIFAAIGEELGLAGTTAILMAFLVLIGSGLRIALRSTRPFDKLFAVGLTTLLGIQAFIIMGGVLRVVPLTGITLPFVSYGGSSLIANYVLLALLLRLSHDQRTVRSENSPRHEAAL